jgi:hypothetical protein
MAVCLEDGKGKDLCNTGNAACLLRVPSPTNRINIRIKM